jgi:hypothetical protein
LDVTHVVEFRRMVARGGPTRIEGQRVRIEHPLKEPNRARAVL